jgi:hypothetical protein
MKLGPLLLMPCLLSLMGCRETMTVIVPAGFHGGVLISCGPDSHVARTVEVDSRGLAEATGCSQSPPRLKIMRNGLEIKPAATNPPAWNETEAGTLAGVTFVVP